jgi:hypothetical protein
MILGWGPRSFGQLVARFVTFVTTTTAKITVGCSSQFRVQSRGRFRMLDRVRGASGSVNFPHCWHHPNDVVQARQLVGGAGECRSEGLLGEWQRTKAC